MHAYVESEVLASFPGLGHRGQKEAHFAIPRKLQSRNRTVIDGGRATVMLEFKLGAISNYRLSKKTPGECLPRPPTYFNHRENGEKGLACLSSGNWGKMEGGREAGGIFIDHTIRRKKRKKTAGSWRSCLFLQFALLMHATEEKSAGVEPE